MLAWTRAPWNGGMTENKARLRSVVRELTEKREERGKDGAEDGGRSREARALS